MPGILAARIVRQSRWERAWTPAICLRIRCGSLLDDGTVWIRDSMRDAQGRISDKLVMCLKRAGVAV